MKLETPWVEVLGVSSADPNKRSLRTRRVAAFIKPEADTYQLGNTLTRMKPKGPVYSRATYVRDRSFDPRNAWRVVLCQ